MKYDLLSESWVQVKTMDGSQKTVGILELFENAHSLRSLNEPSPLDEYSLIRFLCTFLMAAFQPRSAEDLMDILSGGHFKMEQIRAYIEKCRAEGVSFDIFDQVSPFLQSSPDAKWDREENLKSVANLDCTRAHGHNPVHFDHTFEKDAVMTPEQAAKALLTTQIFSTAGTQGPSNVNGAPPLYFLVNGKNLFETLVYAMVPLPATENAAVPEWWRSHILVEPNKKIASTSFLSAMFFPCRRVRLVEDGGLVRKAYFQAGLNFVGYDSWHDPHVAYGYDKNNKRFSMKPDMQKSLWRDIGTIAADYTKRAPQVLVQYQNVFESEGSLSAVVFGTATKQASYQNIQRGELVLDTRITRSQEKSALISACVAKSETLANILEKTLGRLCQKLAHGWENLSRSEIQTYYAECEKVFYGTVCPMTAAAENETQKSEIMAKWDESIQRFIWERYDDFSSIAFSDAEGIFLAEEFRQELTRNLSGKKSRNIKTKKKEA